MQCLTRRTTSEAFHARVYCGSRHPKSSDQQRGKYMGILSRIKDPVEGQAQIVSCSSPPYQATSGMCRMQLVIQAPDIPAFSAQDSRMASVKRWPQPGMVLPVTVDRNDPSRFKLDLDGIPDGRDQAAAQAEQMAAMMRGERPGGPGGVAQPGMAGFAGGVQVIGAATPDQAAAAIRQAEAQLGMDLDGDGIIGGAQPGSATSQGNLAAPLPDSTDDVVSQLERLAQLHRDGLLSRSEFDEQKARLLNQ